HYQPARPLAAPVGGAGGPGAARPASAAGAPEPGALLEISDLLGKRGIETRLRGRVTIPGENAAAALEGMSRVAVDPRGLLHPRRRVARGPPSREPGLLEHPADALASYRREGVTRVVCEEKHMGSRAVIVVCRAPRAAREWFGADSGGIVYTRTGRRFF